ncbi:MAG: hypothetical protein Q7U04_15585 [Bacteriovorax sp.]|nr:hypothetical protein [Bacteriovorax sp.]
MKLIFKNFLLCCSILSCSQLSARDVVLIENLATTAEGELLKSILTKKFHLPKELITLKNTHTVCELKSEAIIHLCLEANGELIVKKMNQYVVKNSLGVFLNQSEIKGEIN